MTKGNETNTDNTPARWEQIDALRAEVEALDHRLGSKGYVIDSVEENLRDLGWTEPAPGDDSPEALAYWTELVASIESEIDAGGY